MYKKNDEDEDDDEEAETLNKSLAHSETLKKNKNHSSSSKTSNTKQNDSNSSMFPHDSKTNDTIINLSISGKLFVTYQSTLEYFPNTLLGNPSLRKYFYNQHLDLHFLDRHASSFESILYFYQSRGRLYRPKDVPLDIFIDELEFFKFEPNLITELLQRENLHLLPIGPRILPRNSVYRRIWLFFEYPTTLLARTVSVFSSCIILLSVISASLETTDFYDSLFTNSTLPLKNLTTLKPLNYQETKLTNLKFYHNPIFYIETFCNLWFLIEFTCRLISCPFKLKFLFNLLNLIDIFIIVTYLMMTVMLVEQVRTYSNTRALGVLRILRLVRIVRLFKLTKYTKLLQVLVLTLRSSVQAIIILMLTLLIGVFLFATLMYYAEATEANSDFHSIPDGFSYVVSVMTTVGDSNAKPKTVYGKMVGSVCAISGILFVAIPIPVIVANFTRYYQVLIENTNGFYGKIMFQNRDDSEYSY